MRAKGRPRRQVSRFQKYEIARIVGRDDPGLDRSSVCQKHGHVLLVRHDMTGRYQPRFADAHGAADRVKGRDGEDRRPGIAYRLGLCAAIGLRLGPRCRRREKREGEKQRPDREPGVGGGGKA